MIKIKNISTIDGEKTSLSIPSEEGIVIDGDSLLLLPALIDPHVHFRTPGSEYKEDWQTAASAAIRGGYTTVCDMPNNSPSIITCDLLEEKKQLVREHLKKAAIPLRAHFYLGADKHNFDQIAKAPQHAIALKIYMGSSTGDLLIDDFSSLETTFRLAAENDVLLAIHAEDEQMIKERSALFSSKDPKIHSFIRSPEVAAKALDEAIELTAKYGARLYVAHVSCKQELDLIRQAKTSGLSVYAEATPHHLFLSTDDYSHLGSKALVNPPLRSPSDREALWEALLDQTIDTIGTDHAPHTLEEKNQPYGAAPSGMPGVQTALPLMLTAYSQGIISLKQIVTLMRDRINTIFRLQPNDDLLLIDLEHEKKLTDDMILSKCRWSPYAGRTLKGWPVATIIENRFFDFRKRNFPYTSSHVSEITSNLVPD